MKQTTFASTGFELVTKRTRKREFLEEMNLVIPWSQLLALIAPHAPAGKTGRPPFATEVMLRIHLLLHFFGLLAIGRGLCRPSLMHYSHYAQTGVRH